jgi:hypothetical protein
MRTQAEGGTVAVDFVVGESEAGSLSAAVAAGGGRLDGAPRPWDVPADLLDDYSDPQFEPLVLVAATVAVGFLVKRISDVYLDHARPGCVVDTRAGKVVVRAAPYLKRGTVVLQSEEGVQVFQPDDRDDALPVIAKLIAAHG